MKRSKVRIIRKLFLLLVLIIILMLLGCPNESASVGGADGGADPFSGPCGIYLR